MALEVGAKYRAKATMTNQTYGIKAGAACWITFLEVDHVSFYAERSPIPGAGWFRARTTLELFGLNFIAEPFSAPNLGYRTSKPETKSFP